MSDLAIQVENLSKAYQLGSFGTGTLTRDIHRWWMLTRGKEDPYLKIGETNDRSVKGTSDIVWSLKDINLEIKEGDAVGIIGRNGAGKSTLLKILSRVTAPTIGNIKLKGRIASLLEVGTGFHPELTGGENIYLNGAIMGMNKREIKRKFDEIVDFSGVERYIDTPVKRYSSGMYVRLAFAVAAYLDAEILVIDEVLAVGDAEFQKKCLGKMGEVSKGGRTVLFVSHNMASIQYLCTTAVLLENGRKTLYGEKNKVIEKYQSNLKVLNSNVPINERKDRNGSGIVKITEFNYTVTNGLNFHLKYESSLSKAFKGKIYISVYDNLENCIIFLDSSVINNLPLEFPPSGEFEIALHPASMLVSGSYTANVALIVDGEWVDHITDALKIEIGEIDFYNSGRTLFHRPYIHISQDWSLH